MLHVQLACVECEFVGNHDLRQSLIKTFATKTLSDLMVSKGWATRRLHGTLTDGMAGASMSRCRARARIWKTVTAI